MATSSAISKLTATEQAQFFYVTYYGRPADPAGLTYWAGVIAKDGLDSVAKNFSNSAEAKVKYPSLGSSSNLTQLKSDIQTLYKTVFGRDPLATDPATGKPYDAGGLDYWYDGVVKGTFSFGQLSIILYNAAAENPVTQQDVLAIGNRATAAQSFTDSLKTPAQIAAYSGQTAVTSTSTWLATVDYRTETVTNAVATKSDLIFNLVINPDKPNTANPVITVAALAVNEDSKDNVGKVTATDADGDKLLYSVDAASAKGGVVSIDAAGSFKYSPAGDFAGSDSFKVTVSDGRGGVSVATVNVTVAEVNAVKATASLAATEDSVASGKIAFDNPGAETLIASVKTPATNGKVAFVSGSADGSFTYTPNENYNGSDVFVIEVKDGTKVSTQTVTVTVASVNDTPVIATAAETISVTEDVAFTTGKVGASDADLKDASPDVITYSAAGAAKGTVSFTAAGDYTYTPKANENGSDSFVITATDKAGAKATKTVAVNIAAVNDAPVAASTASISTNEDVSVKGSMSASDADANDTLAYEVKTQGTKGSVALAADGSYTYTPNKDANGTDSFVLTASDGTATVSQTVSVSIAAVNDAPVLAATATATVAEDSTLSATVSATDPDTGDVLSYAIKTAPTNGLATISAAGVVSYAPKLNYSGADSLEVEVTDAAGAKSRQVLSITVSPVNDAPVAASGTASVVGGAAVTIPLADLISDVETAKDKLQIVDVIASRGNVSVSGT
ncbi:MAG: tandem-95 repeat protein, partial [Betaproteobacteria bacterium]|nr:tandem-95 repeat protein [Betaproteobacteria bacterium]